MGINGNKMKKTALKQCFGSGCGLAPESKGSADPVPDWESGADLDRQKCSAPVNKFNV